MSSLCGPTFRSTRQCSTGNSISTTMYHGVLWTGGFAGGNVACVDGRLGGVGSTPLTWVVVFVLKSEGGLVSAFSRTTPLLAD